MRTVDDVVEIPIVAARGFLKFAIRQPERPGPHRPRLGQHCRILRDRLVLDGVSNATQTLHDFEIFGVKCPIVDQPGLLIEVDSLDDQGVPVPAANRVAQVAGWKSLSMRSPVSRNDAEEATVNIVVEKHYLARTLDDLARRSNTRHAGRLALKHRVGLDLAFAQIFDLRQELALVLRKVCCRRCSRLAAAAGSPGTRWSVATAAWRGARRRWATEYANGTVCQRLGPHEGETSTVVPCPIQVGLAIRQVWRRFRRRCLRCDMWHHHKRSRKNQRHRDNTAVQKMILHGALLGSGSTVLLG